jgi:serine/threonine-protein kinase HipA
MSVERDPVEVSVNIEGSELVAGTLWIHDRGDQSATFRYGDAYLAHPLSYDLEPTLPKLSGVFQTPPGKQMFNAFADSAPDRWGQNLMRREERERARAIKASPRTLRAADFLLGVRDDIRHGAIRFRRPGRREYFSTHHGAVPKLIEMVRLLHAVDHLDAGGQMDRDIKDLINAGGSLGGARPKAAVTDASGRLAIAKFPRSAFDQWDVESWEKLELDLARASGINAIDAELIKVGNRKILVADRFDRRNDQRIGFVSALTMLEASDRECRSYLEIAEVIERHSDRAVADLHELFRRIVFSILTGNSDDHLRNHGFLRSARGWHLSPAYDLNPNPDAPDQLSTAIDLDNSDADLEVALSVADYFRLSTGQARAIVEGVEHTTRDWRDRARALGIPEVEIDLMSAAYAPEQRRLLHRL